MISSIKLVFATVYALVIFVFSYFVSGFYISGDQIFYSNYYVNVYDKDLFSAFDFYKNQLGTFEPGYFFITYIFSGVISKNILMSFFNAVLAFYILLYLFRRHVNFFVIFLLSFNFYLFVLYFSAERLKLSLLFFLIYLSLSGMKSYLFVFLSVFTHVQVVLLFVLSKVSFLIRVLSRLKNGYVIFASVNLIFIFIFISFLYIILSQHIIEKLTFYITAWGGLNSIIKPLAFLGLTLLYSNKKIESLVVSLTIVFIAFFIGSERLTIFSYLIFLYYALEYRKGISVGVIVTSLYFLFKGNYFLYNIFKYGDGFGYLHVY